MRLVHPSFARYLALFTACAPISALAQFSDASLNGRYASRYELSGGPRVNGAGSAPQAVEVLVFDGAGGVTGSRTFTVWYFNGSGPPDSSHVVRQTLVGSYSCDADGLGSLTLSATPVLEMRTLAGSPPGPNDFVFHMSPEETRQLVVQRGGDGLALTGSTELLMRYNANGWAWMASNVLTWSADAVNQDSPCGQSVQKAAVPGMRQPRP